MISGNYFFDDGQSRKFWSYTLDGKKQTIRYGRIGTEGRATTKTFPSASAAETATTQLVNQKIRKGYIQVDPSKLKFQRNKKKWRRPATKAEVASLERRIQAKLPDDYKEFLLTQNGGFAPEGRIGIPGNSQDVRNVGEIYGLYDEARGFTLLWALDKIQPRLPKGHLPIAGWLDFFSMSLDQNVGCIYLWDEDAAPREEVDEEGKVIFNSAHGSLVAGSFNEFLTRMAITKDPHEADEATTASCPDNDQRSKNYEKWLLMRSESSRSKSRLSKLRRLEILRLTDEGGTELTAAYEQGIKAGDTFRRKIHREIAEFLKTTTNKYELDFFAEYWNRDGNEKPIHQLIKNPHVDAGTLLWLYWHSSPEDYYLFNRSASEIDEGFERDVYTTLQRIERRIVKGEYLTAAFPFDPSKRISMWERRSEFARQIPDIMYQPILGGKHRKR